MEVDPRHPRVGVGRGGAQDKIVYIGAKVGFGALVGGQCGPTLGAGGVEAREKNKGFL